MGEIFLGIISFLILQDRITFFSFILSCIAGYIFTAPQRRQNIVAGSIVSTLFTLMYFSKTKFITEAGLFHLSNIAYVSMISIAFTAAFLSYFLGTVLGKNFKKNRV
ncbi:hypothetical protein A2803_01810 [Candidatus Woesebacteria bacterium RIFCSPHIGHO2_01_FULL_44_21]|uniref:Uncharacterized protein n=1 Tax=Candidatus Woesebacteria bacterium RIFCSPHIGHO2_01_FULL_44_21 TaxID=1802503 RepID=A0A1F7YV48_9BACT|nr:MAG: hypothetical protein A2803_01810 [Candidatus Woesebacteria bacterium RIFCSPHIGHO2_01_FULL_44_21]OGM69608.1 MAG: hypothetical protein A2897_03325 [Candidatus Woesebacteria bacterium RIFCSPLOWO2_01_FULL_44_24b]